MHTQLHPLLVSDKDGAALLGISRATFRRRVADGTLPKPIQFGGVARWRREELVAFVESATRRHRRRIER